MISLSRMGMIRAASLAVMLALAAVVMRPLVLSLAAQVWTLDATVADGADPAEHGVRPAKTVLRAIHRLRHMDPVVDPPQPYAAIVHAEEIAASFAGTRDACADMPSGNAAQSLGYRPRGPPGVQAKPDAAGSFERRRAFGSLERA